MVLTPKRHMPKSASEQWLISDPWTGSIDVQQFRAADSETVATRGNNGVLQRKRRQSIVLGCTSLVGRLERAGGEARGAPGRPGQ